MLPSLPGVGMGTTATVPAKPHSLVTLRDSSTFLLVAVRKQLLAQFILLTTDKLPAELQDLMDFWATVESALKSPEKTFKDLEDPIACHAGHIITFTLLVPGMLGW